MATITQSQITTKQYKYMSFEQRIFNELQEIREIAEKGARSILTTDEAAAYMGITKSSLYKLVHKKAVPHFKSAGGKMIYFKRAELDEYLTYVRVPTACELEAMAATRSVTKGGAL